MKERNLFSGDSITFLGLKKKKKITFPARKEMMGNWDYDANVNKAARQWVHV